MKKASEIFEISPSWDNVRSLDELVEDAKFVFSFDGYRGVRPRIVLKTPINKMDVIEIDYDMHGLKTNGETIFNEHLGSRIIDSSVDVIEFIKAFLVKDGAKEVIK